MKKIVFPQSYCMYYMAEALGVKTDGYAYRVFYKHLRGRYIHESEQYHMISELTFSSARFAKINTPSDRQHEISFNSCYNDLTVLFEMGIPVDRCIEWEILPPHKYFRKRYETILAVRRPELAKKTSYTATDIFAYRPYSSDLKYDIITMLGMDSPPDDLFAVESTLKEISLTCNQHYEK